jgi:hypothetical protein
MDTIMPHQKQRRLLLSRGRWSCTNLLQYTNLDLSIADPETAEHNCLTEFESNESNDITNAQVYEILNEFHNLRSEDLFVPQVLRNYSSSEPDLERARIQYFEVIKHESDNFPFGLQAVLKWRVYTRKGDPVPHKLAQDTYNIIAMAEGEDYTLLKDMISTSKQRSSSTVTSKHDYDRHASKEDSCNSYKSCNCANEIFLLKVTECLPYKPDFFC